MIFNTHGTQLQISDMAASPAYTTVAQVESITPPNETRGLEGVPTHDIAAGGFVPQLVDALRTPGNMTLTLVEDLADGTHDDSTGMLSLMAEADPTDFKMIFPSGEELDFSGWVVNRSPQARPSNRGVPRVDYEIALEAGYTLTPAP